jgi:hypothetical protein
MLFRQLAYFGVPMAVLTFGAVSVWSAPVSGYLDHMLRAQSLGQQGAMVEAGAEAQRAFAAMETELPLTTRLVEIDPSSSHRAQLAFLIYNRSYYANVVLPQLEGRAAQADAIAAHRQAAAQAAEQLELALERGGSLQHPGRDEFSQADAERMVASWRRMAGQH